MKIDMDGFTLTLDGTDRGVSKTLRSHGTYQPVLAGLLKEFAKPGMVCLDGGAHIGTFTLLLSGLVGETGWVHAFEPSSRNYAILSENVRANRRNNVVLNHGALGDSNHHGVLYLNETNTGDCRMYPSGQGREMEAVGVVTVDSYMSTQGGKLDILKLDTQGCEFDILRGARNTIRNSPNLILVTEAYAPILEEVGVPIDDLVQLLIESSFSDFRLVYGKRADPVKPERISGTILANPAAVYDIFCRRVTHA